MKCEVIEGGTMCAWTGGVPQRGSYERRTNDKGKGTKHVVRRLGGSRHKGAAMCKLGKFKTSEVSKDIHREIESGT